MLVILYSKWENIQVGDTGPEGVEKQSKNMRAFRHNNKKQGRPTCSWPKRAYCNLYRVLYNLLYMYDLVAIGHLKLKKVRKRSAGKREKERRQARKAP